MRKGRELEGHNSNNVRSQPRGWRFVEVMMRRKVMSLVFSALKTDSTQLKEKKQPETDEKPSKCILFMESELRRDSQPSSIRSE